MKMRNIYVALTDNAEKKLFVLLPIFRNLKMFRCICATSIAAFTLLAKKSVSTSFPYTY